jgi:hypothetical protein
MHSIRDRPAIEKIGRQPQAEAVKDREQPGLEPQAQMAAPPSF